MYYIYIYTHSLSITSLPFFFPQTFDIMYFISLVYMPEFFSDIPVWYMDSEALARADSSSKQRNRKLPFNT